MTYTASTSIRHERVLLIDSTAAAAAAALFLALWTVSGLDIFYALPWTSRFSHVSSSNVHAAWWQVQGRKQSAHVTMDHVTHPPGFKLLGSFDTTFLSFTSATDGRNRAAVFLKCQQRRSNYGTEIKFRGFSDSSVEHFAISGEPLRALVLGLSMSHYIRKTSRAY